MRREPTRRWVFVLSMISLLVAPRVARAQVPRCEGSSPERGEAVTARGKQHYDNATSHASGVDRRELRLALADADEGCALGYPGALLLRAFVLHAERREVEAARCVDGFAASVPEARRSAGQRTALSDLTRELALAVARITVHAEVDDVRVTLDTTEIALDVPTSHAPGAVTVRVVAAGYEVEARPLTLGAGASRSLRVTSVEGADGDDVIALRRTRPSPSPSPSPIAAPRPERPLRAWWSAGAATTGVTLVTAVGFTIWREERASAYSGLGCGAASTSSECVARYSEFSTADTLRTVGWVATGVLAVTTVALWWLDRRDARARHAMRSGCAASLVGVACAW